MTSRVESDPKGAMPAVPAARRSRWAALLVSALVGALVGLVRLYQWTLGPLLYFAFGTACRFEPSCSHYMIGALRKYGPWRGAGRGLARIARCHPWHAGGYDPP